VSRPAAMVALLALLACAPEEPLPGPDVVARIGGQELRHADFERHLRRNLGGEGEALTSEALSVLLDQFLDERLLVRLASDRGLVAAGATPESAADALLGVEPPPEPSAAEVAAWYQAHRAELERPERVEMVQLLLPDRASAERARAALLAGEDPDQLARRAGEEPEAGAGQRGIFARDDLPPAFAPRIFALPEGGVSEVVEADYGFHVFQVLRRIPADAPTLEQASPAILRRLRSEVADRQLRRLVADAASRYAVEVFDRNLPFAYRGSHPVSRPYENR
jgi:PPIC-type PPIASE domain